LANATGAVQFPDHKKSWTINPLTKWHASSECVPHSLA